MNQKLTNECEKAFIVKEDFYEQIRLIRLGYEEQIALLVTQMDALNEDKHALQIIVDNYLAMAD